MAREKMVTRTTTQTTAEVMCLNVETADVTINSYTIGGTPSDEDLLKKLRAIYETETFKLVAIQKIEVETLLLGMTEEEFIKYARVLPPRKNYNTDTEED